jgi:DNA replication initiation complex subunit (GINS family)
LYELSKKKDQDPSQKALFEKALSQSKDIINCRLHKIVYLATNPSITDTTIRKMAVDERRLYNDLSPIINEWKNKILNLEDEE